MHTAMPGPLLTPAEHRTYLDELDRLHEVRDQAVIDARIERLKELLATARVVDGETAPEIVTLGRSAEVKYLRTGRVVTYRVAGIPGGSGSGTVSASSPVGAALIGRGAGEIVAVELPGGRSERLEILGVVDAEAAA